MIGALRIMITNECRNDCAYCFVKSSPNYTCQSGDGPRIIAALQQAEYKSLELIGGEPFHDLDLVRLVFEHNTKPVAFFTSGTYNQEAALRLCLEFKDQFPIKFFFSYDGRNSLRNWNNYEEVKDTIRSFQEHFPVSVRWSVNREDIHFLCDHFLELHEMGIDMPIFFPMKYADYTEEDIALFSSEFDKLLGICIERNISFNGLLSDGLETHYGTKANFVCEQEQTILPDGRFTNCYVSYSSYGCPHDMTSESRVEPTVFAQAPPRCGRCLNVFSSCNKCPGNLKEYQLKTGNYFFDSYCDLMQALAKVFMTRRLQWMPQASFHFYQGQRLTSIVKEANGDVVILRREGIL